MVKGYYKCECGKEFDNPQEFNSHKGHCDVHLINKYGSLESFKKRHQRNHENVSQKLKELALKRETEAMEAWIGEGHRCERCGKILTEKYGSGRFCSRSCANSKKLTEEQRNERRLKLINNPNFKPFKSLLDMTEEEMTHFYENRKLRASKARSDYELSPRKCVICGNIIDYQHRNNKTCCKECKNKLNILNNSCRNFYNSRRGKFNGILFDSTYELAFYVYCKDNCIQCIRNTEVSFPYTYKNEVHYYYPDFYIPSINTYIEIKGREAELDRIKIQSVREQGVQIKMLKKDDLQEVFDFIKNKYNLHCNRGGNDFYLLYDESKQLSWV